MSYTSYFYLLFFLGVLGALYYLIPLKKRWLVLLGGSYFFYWMAFGLSGSSGYGAGAAGL